MDTTSSYEAPLVRQLLANTHILHVFSFIFYLSLLVILVITLWMLYMFLKKPSKDRTWLNLPQHIFWQSCYCCYGRDNGTTQIWYVLDIIAILPFTKWMLFTLLKNNSETHIAITATSRGWWEHSPCCAARLFATITIIQLVQLAYPWSAWAGLSSGLSLRTTFS